MNSVKEDWVEVSKRSIKILIHYPNQQADECQFEKLKGDQMPRRGSSWDYLEQAKSWDRLAAMQWQNKFSVALKDLAGKWNSSSYASLRYYYVNGGGFAIVSREPLKRTNAILKLSKAAGFCNSQTGTTLRFHW
jgi:hypothetical protein